jgi:hypothetical protein
MFVAVAMMVVVVMVVVTIGCDGGGGGGGGGGGICDGGTFRPTLGSTFFMPFIRSFRLVPTWWWWRRWSGGGDGSGIGECAIVVVAMTTPVVAVLIE